MEDSASSKGGSVVDIYKDGIKRKRHGRDKESRMKDLSDESSGESSVSSSQTLESKHKSRKKEQKLKESIIKRMMDDKMEGSPASITVSIERKKYETATKFDETQIKSSPNFESTGKSSLGPKSTNNPNKIESQEVHTAKNKEKYAISNHDVGKEIKSKKIISDSSYNSSVLKSIDAIFHTQEQSSKEETSKADNLDLLIKEECKIVGRNVLQAETSLDFKKDSPTKREVKSEKSASRSSSSSVSKGKYTHRPRDKKRGLERPVDKDKSRVKRMPTKDNRGKFNRKGHGGGRRNLLKKNRGSSVSSTSSSSSKSFSDSSSSTSGSSSISSSSRSSSVSKYRSSSSSSSSSTSSIRPHHKRSFKTKESAKHRSRSPLNIRRKSNQPPRPKKIHVGHLSKNINKLQLYEIFSLYGIVKNVDLPLDRTNGHTSRGFAYVEYNHSSDAEKAVRHMDGGIIDGQKIAIAPVLLYKPRPITVKRISPNKPHPLLNWRYTAPFRNRGGGAMLNDGARDNRRRIRFPPRRKSLRRRTRSRSPNRRHPMTHRSLSSSH